VTDNILNLQETLPENVMFVVEETISIFNLLYLQELEQWIGNNFTTNREGDIVNHTRHLAHGSFNLQNMSQEYIDLVKQSPQQNLILPNWAEHPDDIKNMLTEIKKFDNFRNESFEKVFPELVNNFEKTYKTVNYQELIPIMLSKMKQMQNEIHQLKELVVYK
jgi:hypothetical protein